MISPRYAHHIINIELHVLILFSFLTIFFFVYITKQESTAIQNEFNNVIDKNTSSFLDSIDYLNYTLYPKIKINWNKINQIGSDIETKYKDKIDPIMYKNNNRLKKTAIGIIIGLTCLLLITVFYFVFYKKYKIDLKDIIITNIIIAILLGISEYLFFSYIGSKYVPVNKSQLVDDFVDRIQTHVNKQLS